MCSVAKPFGTQRVMCEFLKSDSGPHTVEFWFCFALPVTVPPVLPSGSKKICNLFLILWEPTMKRLWGFTKTLEFHR